MRSIILSLSFVACGSPELEQKNADLAAKLERSQEKEASLKKEVDRLKTKLQKMERSLSDMKKSETLRELGMKKEGQLLFFKRWAWVVMKYLKYFYI